MRGNKTVKQDKDNKITRKNLVVVHLVRFQSWNQLRRESRVLILSETAFWTRRIHGFFHERLESRGRRMH